MTWVPGRGRPVAMPSDNTLLRGRSVDAKARIAWLLRLSRLAAVPGPAGEFLKLLRAHGCKVGPSTLCRYETGVERVPLSVVHAYEAALELPAGQLVGVICGVDRMFGPALAQETTAPMSRFELSEALGEWEGRVRDGSMRGIDWVRATDVITRPTGPVLPPSVLSGWVEQLLAETMRSVRHAMTTRMHALSLLLADRGAGRIVLDGVERVCLEPGAQGLRQVIALLGQSSDPVILQWLLHHFERSDGELQWGVAHALLTQVCRGTLPMDLLPALESAVVTAASDGLDRGRPAFMIAQRVSASLTQQVVVRLGRYPAPTMPGARVQSPAGLSHYRAAGLDESGLDDPMLDRLLREALSPDFVERQHYSLLMLAASPYRDVLADTAAEQLRTPVEPYAAEAAAHLLVYLARPEQQQQLVEMLVTSGHRRSVLEALARAGGVPDNVDLAALVDDHELTAAAVFAAGMGNHPDLGWFATDPGHEGTELQCRAAWWMQSGPAVTDSVTTRSTGGARPVALSLAG